MNQDKGGQWHELMMCLPLWKFTVELKTGCVDIQPRSNNYISSLTTNIKNHLVIELNQQYNQKEGFKEEPYLKWQKYIIIVNKNY